MLIILKLICFTAMQGLKEDAAVEAMVDGWYCLLLRHSKTKELLTIHAILMWLVIKLALGFALIRLIEPLKLQGIQS